jgi:hypothetical protein
MGGSGRSVNHSRRKSWYNDAMNSVHTTLATVFIAVFIPGYCHTAGGEKADVESIVTKAVQPLMQREGIPGMAVAIACTGQSYVFNYGLASRATGKPITDDTLFEVGSVRKLGVVLLANKRYPIEERVTTAYEILTRLLSERSDSAVLP